MNHDNNIRPNITELIAKVKSLKGTILPNKYKEITKTK